MKPGESKPRVARYVTRWLPAGIDVVHLGLTMVMCIWAYTLWLPEETFPTSKMYTLFVLCWPYTEPGWAAVFAVPAVIGIAALFVPRQRKVLRLNLSGVLMVAHVLLTLMAYGGNPSGTGWRVYAFVFVPFAIWRVLAEAYIEWVPA